MIPEYLLHLSRDEKVKNCRTIFEIVCECGEERFWLYSNYFTPDEEKQMEPHDEAMRRLTSSFIGFECHRDKAGNFRYYKLIFPFFKKEVVVPEAPAFVSVECWKAECSRCGKQHLLFDNRFYGYDGVFCRNEESVSYKPHFKKVIMQKSEPVKLEIEVAHDPSPEQIREETGEDIDAAAISNAFGWICVRRIDKQGKRKIVLDYETA